MYTLDLMNWRLSTPGADSFPTDVAEYLDLVSALCGDDVGYYRCGVNHCDVFDVVSMLDFLKEGGLVTDADTKLWQRSRDAINATRINAYMTRDEMNARMQHADGACPFCGFHISFSSERDERHGFHAFSRCQHWRFDYVDDVDAALRRPQSWDGKRWPYSWHQLIARPDGSPLRNADQEFPSHHCSDCRTRDARRIFGRKVRQVLGEMVEKAQTEGWTEPGWGNACSNVDSRFLDRMATEIVTDDSHEFRLNGAGLKLYTRGVSVGFVRGEIRFNMRVGGDQAAHYPQFVAWANARLAELKLTEDALRAEAA